MPRLKRGSVGGHLRTIATMLEGANYKRFPLYLRVAAKEIAELRWENGVLRRKLNMKKRPQMMKVKP